ncbi:MAG TPA: hypothetical protein VHO26_08735 [Propionibacteriaceae bacterium]|nr:hypothetical protein [Propionibacteriaceae bacterium]HEX2857546.1 hypothetical protein [Propionibacteriaceae bacterium]
MVTRIHFDDAEGADEAAETLYAAGYEVAIVRERFAGEDDDEDIDYVVATPASKQEAMEALGDVTEELFISEE